MSRGNRRRHLSRPRLFHVLVLIRTRRMPSGRPRAVVRARTRMGMSRMRMRRELIVRHLIVVLLCGVAIQMRVGVVVADLVVAEGAFGRRAVPDLGFAQARVSF